MLKQGIPISIEDCLLLRNLAPGPLRARKVERFLSLATVLLIRNRLTFELQCSATTNFKGFVELSSLPLYLGRFGGRKEV